MPCYRPLKGWLAKSVNKSGKRSVVFRVSDGLTDRPVDVPCGQCIGCRLERSVFGLLAVFMKHRYTSVIASSLLLMTTIICLMICR